MTECDLSLCDERATETRMLLGMLRHVCAEHASSLTDLEEYDGSTEVQET